MENAKDSLEVLTTRNLLAPYVTGLDLEIVVMMLDGKRPTEIARALGLTEGRVRHRYFTVFRRLDVVCKLLQRLPVVLPV